MKKLKVIILLILAVLLFAVTGSIPVDAVPDEIARKVAVFKEIYKPLQIDVDSNFIYVSQLSTIYIYSLEDFQKKKFTKEDKDRILDQVKKTRSPENFERFKRNARFPEVFPAIHNLFIDNEKIYVKTHKTENNRAEFFIFDIKGKLLKTTMIPLVDRLPKTNFPYVIKDNKLYQLVENQDTEMIELYTYEIK